MQRMFAHILTQAENPQIPEELYAWSDHGPEYIFL